MSTSKSQCLCVRSRNGELQATVFCVACEGHPAACSALAKPAAGLDSRPVWVWDIPSSSMLSAARCALRDSLDIYMISGPPLLVSSSEIKSVPVAWSLERYARHTQTVNLDAPLTLPVGHTRGRHCP